MQGYGGFPGHGRVWFNHGMDQVCGEQEHEQEHGGVQGHDRVPVYGGEQGHSGLYQNKSLQPHNPHILRQRGI